MSSARYILFLVVAAVLFLVMQRTYIAVRGQHEVALNHTLNGVVSTKVINLLSPDLDAKAVDGNINARGASIDVKKGCEGIEVMLLFVAVLLAYPMGWRHKLSGVLLGCLLIYVVNIVRIVSLFFIVLYYPSLFDAMHITIWQTIIIILAGLFFMYWIGRAPEMKGAQADVQEAGAG